MKRGLTRILLRKKEIAAWRDSNPRPALFGEKDKNIDPVQGFEAYRLSFKTATNNLNRVEMIADANHLLL